MHCDEPVVDRTRVSNYCCEILISGTRRRPLERTIGVGSQRCNMWCHLGSIGKQTANYASVGQYVLRCSNATPNIRCERGIPWVGCVVH